MLINFATSPEHRLHTCLWTNGTAGCGSEIPGHSIPTHFREHHGIVAADARPIRCRWEGCMDTIAVGHLFLHIQQKHLIWRYPCLNCGMEFARKAARNAHFVQCKNIGN
ncbi:hypothetical protein ID866_8040 [Astraeus odoratus]|nr:hypothetical protein ID866_8040 [Astraeus odoratus]